MAKAHPESVESPSAPSPTPNQASLPTWFSLLSWLAGVLDVKGCFNLRRNPEGVAFAAVVRVYCDAEFAQLLVDRLATGRVTQAGWEVPAHEQEDLLRRVLPYMQDPRQRHLAGLVYKFRFTQPRRKVGWNLSPQHRAYRKRLR